MAWILGFLGAMLGLAAGAVGKEAIGMFGGALIGALAGICIALRDRINKLERYLGEIDTYMRALAAHLNQARDGAAGRHPAQEPRVTPATAPAPPPAPKRDTGAEAEAPRTPATTTLDLTASVAATPADSDASTRKPEPDSGGELQIEPIEAARDDLADAHASDPLHDAAETVATAAPTTATTASSQRATHRTTSRRPGDDATDGNARGTASEIASSGFWRWFGEGNWVAKIGIGMLFVAVGALLRLAAVEGWLSFPIEYRFIGVALAALVGLGIGWRQRHQRPVFALNLQGGMIGILLLTVFAAYRLYGLMPSGMTFGLLLALVAGCAVLAILQDSLGLAVFGIIGGFAAPILASSGSGDHVALFSYYALLNLAIIAISWSKGWRILNLLGFLFTFLIGTVWGVLRYRPELFASTEPFLILFFAMYLLIPLLPALRNPDPDARDRVDGSLVFGTPLIGFGLQAALLQHDRFGLAWSALALAAIYTLLAWWVWRHAGLARWRKAYAGLALVFATLAVPLALSARWTSAVWAVEGALLVWLGIHQDERRLRWAGLLMQLLGGVALLVTLQDWQMHDHHAFAFGAVLVAIAGLFSAVQYDRRGGDAVLPALLAGWGFAWWYAAGFTEIDRHAPDAREVDIALLLFAGTALLGAALRGMLNFKPFGWPAHLGLLLALPMVALMTLAHGSPLADAGWQSWLVYAVASLVTLRLLDRDDSKGLVWTHALWWLALPLIAWLEIRACLDAEPLLGEGWRLAALSLPVLVPLTLFWKRVALAGMPVRHGTERLGNLLMPLFAFAAVGVATLILFMPGGSAPLPWLPLLNPLELTQIAAVLILVRCYVHRAGIGVRDSAAYLPLLAFGFAALSMATLRSVHHLGGEPWGMSMLAHALPNSALSIVWTSVGVIAMVIGARRSRRSSWIAGATVLGLVLAKLLIVDRTFLSDLWGIVSLLGVGLLFVAVGFFAPMPPRDSEAGTEPSS
jgi:uncharacterized membrane protein